MSPVLWFVLAAFAAGAATAELAVHLRRLRLPHRLLALGAADLCAGLLLGWWLL